MAINEKREKITTEDVEWVVENGQYTPRIEKKIPLCPQIGCVNGLAVYGANMGTIMEIEASAKKVKYRKGMLKITGIIEEEVITSANKKIKRKGTAFCSVENVITVLEHTFNLNCDDYDIHLNFPGGIPIDGPSAGIAIACAIYSSINKIPIHNKIAMTGEISLQGTVKAIGGITAKILAAKKAGVDKVIIPKDNYQESFQLEKHINIIPVEDIKEVLALALISENQNKKDFEMETASNILSASSLKSDITL